MFLLLSLFVISPVLKASCEYVVINPSPFNFQAEITVINTGNIDVSGWDVSWTYIDGTVAYGASDTTGTNYQYIFTNSNPTFTAAPANFNPSNPPDHFTLSPNEQVIITVTGGVTGGNTSNSITPDSLTGDLCGPATVSQSLTIVKEIINDDAGSATVNEFGLMTNAGTLSFGSPTGTGSSADPLVYTSTPITGIAAGTYSLIESDFTAYTEGTWNCIGAVGTVVDTFNAGSVEIGVGENVTCTIVNDDEGLVVPLPTEVSASVCSINPATAFFLRAAEWNSNDTSDRTAGIIQQASVFSSVSSFLAGPGISADASNSTTIISGATEANFTAAYMAGDYIDYTVETVAGLAATNVLSGLSENGGRDGTAPYQMDILVSDDDFTTAIRILSNYVVDTTSGFDWITTGLEQIYLSSGTEYKFRVVFYGANPSTTNIMMDDFAISVDNCTDRGDAPYATNNENAGGHYLPEIRSYYIGSIFPDAEAEVPSDDNTDGETTAGEEDGVVLPIFSIGQVATIDVPVTGSGGLLNAWIDWDGDQVFDADEKIATDATFAGVSGTISLNVTAPTDAVLGSTYSRFRWSPNSVVNPTDFVAEGEIEDYQVTIAENVEPELTATKTTSTTADFAGNTANYTILVTNSVGEAVDVVISDTPENAGFTYASSTVTLNNGATRLSTGDPTFGDSVMNWSSFTIPSGGSVEIDLTMDVASSVPAGVYDNSVSLTTSSSGAIINNYDGTVTANVDEDVVIHQLSPLAGSLVINEVLYRATGNTSTTNDEFVELYNAGSSSIDLSGLMLIDGNKVTGDLDGTTGSITGDTMSFEFICTGSQACTGSTVLAPGEYAVVWVGTQDLTTRNATGASFQAWLGQTQKLANGADDVWLFGANNEFIDYVAWGSSAAAAVDTDYPPGVWDDSVQTSLDGNASGASISLTPNGIDGDESSCWEETLSTDSSARCSGYLPTIDTDTVGIRLTSVGGNNNGGTIIIEKQTLPDGSTQSFDFTGDITASLTDGNSSVPLNVVAGTYTVTESALTGWSVTSIVCDDTDSTGDIGTATASFNVVAGETVRCVFTNEQNANLTLLKIVNNTNDGGAALAADWTLEANLGGGAAEISGVSGVTMGVIAGDYVLSELNGPLGYTFVSLVCDTGVFDASTNTLTLAAGDNSTCTFTNRDLITDLSVTKMVDETNPSPTDPLTFTLTIVNNGADDATNVVINDTVLTGFTFDPGSMTGGDSQNQAGPGLVWTIDFLPAGTANAVTLTYEVTVNTP